MKIPYMLIVGAKEEEQGLVSVRSRFAQAMRVRQSLHLLLTASEEEVRTRTLRETVVVEEEKKEK